MAAAPSSLGEEIREELTCSICLELFTRPKVLPCQHTFCQDCLQDIAGSKLRIKCPNCRRQVRLPPQGVAGLPDSHIVSNMCNKLQQQTSLSGEMREQPQSGNRCSFHPSEEVKLYCKQCNGPVCNECLDEAHSDHVTISLKKALEETRAPIRALITEGRNVLETYCSFLKSLREKEKALNEQKQQTDKNINETYNQMVQKLAENRDCLLSTVDKKHRKNVGMFQKKKDSVLVDVNELSAACDQAEQQMEQGGVKLFTKVTSLKMLVGKYRRKAAPTPVQTQPAVFQPTDAPVLVLGHVTLPEPVAYAPSQAVSGNVAERGRSRGHHHGNQRQEGNCQGKTITFGRYGSGAGQFELPFGVAVSDIGIIFVADIGNKRIQVFTLQGTFVRQFPTVVSGRQKMNPVDVALDGEGNLWVVGVTWYQAEFAVQYTKQGRVLRKFVLQSGWGRRVAVDTRKNHILITQTTGHGPNLRGEVQVFKSDGTIVRTVHLSRTWMSWFASLLWQQKRPRCITVDGEGNILVSDSVNHCVYVFNEDGQFLFQFGGEGSGEGQLRNPQGICTDKADNIIVADKGNHRVEMFDKTGWFLKHISEGMECPWGVETAIQGQLVVTDHAQHTVHVIQSY